MTLDELVRRLTALQAKGVDPDTPVRLLIEMTSWEQHEGAVTDLAYSERTGVMLLSEV